MKCIKKPFATKQKAEAAKDYHNLQGTDKGWKMMKGVYYCEEHKGWHITSMKAGDIKARKNWLSRQQDNGNAILKQKDRIKEHYLELFQKKLETVDGTYRRPTMEWFDKLMLSMIGLNKRYPIKYKYIDMWWKKLPEDKKFHN